MRKVIALAATAVAVLCLTSSASAFEGGGRKPSEAPLIVVGQHYNAQLNNHLADPEVSSRKLTVHPVPYA